MKRWNRKNRKIDDRRLLNPHGSDETDNIHILWYNILVLLNPHGSDETYNAEAIIDNIDFFLTHTVQMKQNCYYPSRSKVPSS